MEQTMGAEWFVKRNDKKLGPFSGKDLRRLATAGKLATEDLVWKEGLSDWVSVSRIESLFETQTDGSPPAAMPAVEMVAVTELNSANDESEWNINAALGDEDEYPPLPPAPKRIRAAKEPPQTARSWMSTLNSSSGGDSTDRLCWWWRFYAVLFFISSMIISAPMLVFGLLATIISLAGLTGSMASKDENAPLLGGVVFGMSLAWSFFYVVIALVWFAFLNVFTLGCCSAAEHLKLLKSQHVPNRS
jgi:hypothetical protein